LPIHEDTFWAGKTAVKFLALHSESLKALSVPFCLVRVLTEWTLGMGPGGLATRLNLSQTQLESLVITGTDDDDGGVHGLMLELLPRTLAHVVVRSFAVDSTENFFVRVLQDLLDSAAKLPGLRSLSVTCRDLAVKERLYLKIKIARGICLSVRFRGAVAVDAGPANCVSRTQARTVFEAAASLYIKSDDIFLHCFSNDLSMLARVLCPDSLQDCVLHAGEIRIFCGSKSNTEIPIWDVIRMLLKHRSSAFAFACGTDGKGRTCLCWRRWPAPDSVAWHEAAAAHKATLLKAHPRLLPPPPLSGAGQPAEDDDAQSDASSWLASDTESEEVHW